MGFLEGFIEGMDYLDEEITKYVRNKSIKALCDSIIEDSPTSLYCKKELKSRLYNMSVSEFIDTYNKYVTEYVDDYEDLDGIFYNERSRRGL